MENIYTYLVQLPPRVRSFVSKNADDCYTVMINSLLCEEAQENAYKHELEHIIHGDFDEEKEVGSLECERHHSKR